MSNCGRHDQGKDTWRDKENVQHQERLHSWGRGGGQEGECLGIRVKPMLSGGGKVAVVIITYLSIFEQRYQMWICGCLLYVRT